MTTKNLIPRASGEGGIGITNVTWGYGYYDTGNFNKGLFVKGSGIEDVIANTVTQGGLGGEWTRNVLDIYYNGGNVGIGTANPDVKLHLAGEASSIIRLENTDLALPANRIIGGLEFEKQDPSGQGSGVVGGLRMYSEDAIGASTYLALSTSSATSLNQEAMRISSAGNVGIGASNPSKGLEIVNKQGILIRENQGGMGNQMPLISSSIADRLDQDDWGIAIKSVSESLSNGYGIAFWTRDSFSGSSTEKFRIDKDGNVGIGTTNPDNLLHVMGDAHSKVLIQGGNSHAIGLQIKQPLVGVDQVWQLQSEAGNTALQIRNGTTDTVVQHMNANGNVGIGTTNPKFRLDIADSSTMVLGGSEDGSGRRTNNFLKSSRVGGIAYTNSNPPVNMMMHTSSATESNLFIGWGTSLMHAPTKITFATAAINTSSSALTIKRMVIDSAGNVGIGTTDPGSYKLYINGTARVSGGDVTSDDRVKHNEQTIVGAIEILGKLTPKKYIKTTEMYDADHDFELDANGDPVDENGEPVAHAIEAGVIAQKVLEVPELAFTVSPEGVDEDGNVTSPHGLNYNSLFTYAIAAIQEQQQLIEDLKSRIETLENK